MATPVSANTNFASTYTGFARTGLFGRTAGSTRQLSGATYYGVMNMSDNAYEICVSVQNASGLAFDGSLHGDGNLAASGDANQTNWTNFASNSWRGSSYSGSAAQARISDRQNVSIYVSTYGYDAVLSSVSIRLARTAQ